MNENILQKHQIRAKRIRHFIEFFIVGVLLDISENLLVVFFGTNEHPLTFRVVFFATLFAFPFAMFTELVVDKPKFRDKVEKMVLKFIRKVE